MTKVYMVTEGNVKDFLSPVSGRQLASKMIRTVRRLTEIGMMEARNDYMEKRKTDKLPSLIFDSFNYETELTGGTSVTGVFFCGGPKASWAIYVDQPRPFRGGKGSFPGYFFMDAGMEKVKEEADKVAKEEGLI